jgi:UDP-glucose 4-epimerase
MPADECNHVDPLSPHAVAKLSGEMYLRAYAEMYGLAPICMASANVYGPRQLPHGEAGVIAALGSAMVTGRPFVMCTDGAAAHDYVCVEDVVERFCSPVVLPSKRQGHTTSARDHVTVAEVRNLRSAVLDGASVPSVAGGDMNAIVLDANLAARELEWKPRVDLAEGIQRTIRWLCATLEPEPPGLVGACLTSR